MEAGGAACQFTMIEPRSSGIGNSHPLFRPGRAAVELRGVASLTTAEKNRLALRISSIVNHASAAIDSVQPARSPQSKHRDRKAARTPTFKQGKIRLSNGAWAPCVIADFDSSGCRVKMDGAQGLPDQVEIAILAISVRRRATVCWRTEHEAGCRFDAIERSD